MTEQVQSAIALARAARSERDYRHERLAQCDTARASPRAADGDVRAPKNVRVRGCRGHGASFSECASPLALWSRALVKGAGAR